MTAPPVTNARGAGRPASAYPYLLLALAQLIWAGNWVIGRAVRETMPPLTLTFWRWSIAALLLAPLGLVRLRGNGAVVRQSWRVLVLLGVLGAGFFQAMVYIGLRYTEAVNATMMYSASPLFIILMAYGLGVERVRPGQLAGMAVSFCGILVILVRGEIGSLREVRFNPGDFLILLAMPAWGLYCALLSRRPRELDGTTLLFLVSTVGALALLPFFALETALVGVPHLTWAALGVLLYIGLGASVISYLLWNRGVALIGPSRAGVTNHLLPAFTTALAVLLLGEALRPFHVVGIATILCGVWIASIARAGG